MAPPTITGLRGSGQLTTVTLDWTPVPWATVVDHYAVYVASGSSWNLAGKTVYPRFVHRKLGFTGVTRSYRVVTVDAAGNTSAAVDCCCRCQQDVGDGVGSAACPGWVLRRQG